MVNTHTHKLKRMFFNASCRTDHGGNKIEEKMFVKFVLEKRTKITTQKPKDYWPCLDEGTCSFSGEMQVLDHTHSSPPPFSY